jgi:hypothetical protein
MRILRHLDGKWPIATLDPDGGGAQGDPDPDPLDAPVKTDPAIDAAKAVADGIRAALAEARVATPPAPVVPAGPSMADRQAALQREADDVNTRVDALSADGKFAEALALRDQFVRKANATLAPSIDDDVTVQTAVAIGERLAKAEHKDVMSKWGDEVKRAVAAMPAHERVRPDAWDRAVQTTKLAHFDEIMNERVETTIATRRAEFMPPDGASMRARKREGAAAKLNEDQLWGMDITGVDAEAYTKHLKVEEEFDKLPMSKRGPGYGYPIMEPTATIKPGQF